MRPKFSIIIPVYNVAPYLHGCLDSVLAQTFADWEVICVDDGSTDDSGEIAEEFAARDSRISVIHQRNSGAGLARNRGLKSARGKYVGFLDGDDRYDVRLLETLVGVVKDVSADFIRIPIKVVEKDHDEVAGITQNEGIGGYRGRDKSVRSMISMMYGGVSCFVRSDTARRVGFVAIPNGEDVLFSVGCFLQSANVVELNTPMYYYLQRKGSATHTITKELTIGLAQYARHLVRMVVSADDSAGYLLFLQHRVFSILGGSVLGMMTKLPESERNDAWEDFFGIADEIFSEKKLYPIWVRAFAGFVIQTKSKFLVSAMMRVPVFMYSRIRRRLHLG